MAFRESQADREAFLQSLEGRQHDLAFPAQVVIETTAACNLSCSHCGHGVMRRPKGHMSMPLYRKLIDEIA